MELNRVLLTRYDRKKLLYHQENIPFLSMNMGIHLAQSMHHHV